MPRKDHNVDSIPLPRAKFGCRRDMDEISFLVETEIYPEIYPEI